MKRFVVILTPPFVDTAAGLPDKVFQGAFPHQFQRELIAIPSNPTDTQRVQKLGRSSDIVAFTFTSSNAALKTVCDDIANDINKNAPVQNDLKILVEGAKGDLVIALSGISSRELSDRIYGTL